jgi:hypothetical protein
MRNSAGFSQTKYNYTTKKLPVKTFFEKQPLFLKRMYIVEQK